MGGVTNNLLMETGSYAAPLFLLTLSSVLSTFGSGTIIFWVLHKRKTGSIFHRIMLGLSLTDVVASLDFLLQPYLAPKGSGLPFAVGNEVSCEWASFFALFAFSSWLYSAELSLYFYLSIVRGWSDEDTVDALEPWVHIFPWGFATASGVLGHVMNLHGMQSPTGFCTINGIPDGATRVETVVSVMNDIVLMIVYLIIPLVVGVTCTWKVYAKVRATTQRQLKWSFGRSCSSATSNDSLKLGESAPTRELNAVGLRCVCYTVGFLNSLMVTISMSSLVTFEITNAFGYGLLCVVSALHPAQGAINGIVFVRPALVRGKAEHPDKSWWWVFLRALAYQPTTR